MSDDLEVLRRVLDVQDGGPSAAGLSDADLTGAAEAAVRLSRWADAALSAVSAAMAMAAGQELLGRAGVASPGGLSEARRERWRAQTKSVVAREIRALSGWGIQECHRRVAFALAPAPATQNAQTAMVEGRAGWLEVSWWWQRCREMHPSDAAAVAQEVFATDVSDGEASDPGASSTAAQDGYLDQHGRLRRSRAQLRRVLDRAATRVEGSDPDASRQRRRAAVDARGAWSEVEEDGTGVLAVSGRSSTVVAAMHRVDTVARRARAAGDSRTLDQLRSDAALALLTVGALPSCGPAGAAPDSAAAALDSAGAAPDSADPATGRAVEPALDPASGGGWDAAATDRLTAALAGLAPAVVEVIMPSDVLTGADPDGVAELSGAGFITGEHAREIALTPGTVLHRLVTDPVTGHALERSLATYAPDAQMRALVQAADRLCRAPGCTVPATQCDLDHVIEHPEGPTSGTNLAADHRGDHAPKTNRWWTCVMDETRRLTWTTLFGRVYRTMPYDYRGYSGSAGGRPDPTRSLQGAVLSPDVQDQALYAALAHRAPGSPLESRDDDPDAAAQGWASPAELARSGLIGVRHRASGGRKVVGPPHGQPTPEEILSPSRRELDSAVAHDDDAPPF